MQTKHNPTEDWHIRYRPLKKCVQTRFREILTQIQENLPNVDLHDSLATRVTTGKSVIGQSVLQNKKMTENKEFWWRRAHLK